MADDFVATEAPVADNADVADAPAVVDPAPQPEGHHAQQQPRDETGKFAKRTVRFKDKGREWTEELTQDEVDQRLNRERASYNRFEEAANIRKDAERKLAEKEAQFRALTEDPNAFENFLRSQNKDPHDFMVERMHRLIQMQQMDPRDRRIMELEMMQRQRQHQEQQQVQQEKQTEFEARRVTVRNELTKTLTDAIARNKMPQDQETLAIAARFYLANKKGGVDVSADDVVRHVNGIRRSEMSMYVEELPAEQIEVQYPSLYRKIHAHLVQKVRGARTKPATQAQPVSTPKPEPKPPGPMSPTEWKKFFGGHE